MLVLVSGASGLIGSALTRSLHADGHEVRRLTRGSANAADEVRWDTEAHTVQAGALDDVDAVVHLAGAGIADRRWNEDYKRTIESSRVEGTTTISAAIAAADPRPQVLLSASAVGFYGDAGETAVDESAPVGSGFLPEVCARWEAATSPAAAAGVRVVHLRTGLVLSPSGGTMGRIRPLFAAGLGGKLGSGRQYWPWISLADHVAALRFLLDEHTGAELDVPVNLTGPVPVTNQTFTRTLGALMHRPTLLPVPAAALRAVLGGFADEGVLASQRVLPRRLLDAGFHFAHTDVGSALRWALTSS